MSKKYKLPILACSVFLVAAPLSFAQGAGSLESTPTDSTSGTQAAVGTGMKDGQQNSQAAKDTTAAKASKSKQRCDAKAAVGSPGYCAPGTTGTSGTTGEQGGSMTGSSSMGTEGTQGTPSGGTTGTQTGGSGNTQQGGTGD